MCVCVHVCMYVCMCVCMYRCMYVCMHVCMYVCVCMCVCVYVCHSSPVQLSIIARALDVHYRPQLVVHLEPIWLKYPSIARTRLPNGCAASVIKESALESTDGYLNGSLPVYRLSAVVA